MVVMPFWQTAFAFIGAAGFVFFLVAKLCQWGKAVARARESATENAIAKLYGEREYAGTRNAEQQLQRRS